MQFLVSHGRGEREVRIIGVGFSFLLNSSFRFGEKFLGDLNPLPLCGKRPRVLILSPSIFIFFTPDEVVEVAEVVSIDLGNIFLPLPSISGFITEVKVVDELFFSDF